MVKLLTNHRNWPKLRFTMEYLKAVREKAQYLFGLLEMEGDTMIIVIVMDTLHRFTPLQLVAPQSLALSHGTLRPVHQP